MNFSHNPHDKSQSYGHVSSGRIFIFFLFFSYIPVTYNNIPLLEKKTKKTLTKKAKRENSICISRRWACARKKENFYKTIIS
ncbi:hypothetical protein GDO78_016816 [Eleutherodactylus coqui]|uniref:Uncharacterized protein n=1 Tax=Eleutherodactylus coqui TaxID=57060 RepID=A0A8J6BR85_ELECQ|nr:hypothetical protein GDO78_016816 [Eleutherodactylus coqui]